MSLAAILGQIGQHVGQGLLDKGIKYGMELLQSGRGSLSNNLQRIRGVERLNVVMNRIQEAEKMLQEEINEMQIDQQ